MLKDINSISTNKSYSIIQTSYLTKTINKHVFMQFLHLNMLSPLKFFTIIWDKINDTLKYAWCECSRMAQNNESRISKSNCSSHASPKYDKFRSFLFMYFYLQLNVAFVVLLKMLGNGKCVFLSPLFIESSLIQIVLKAGVKRLFMYTRCMDWYFDSPPF